MKKVSKYYENGSVQNFLYLFKSLLIDIFVSISHILARICFIFLKNVLTFF